LIEMRARRGFGWEYRNGFTLRLQVAGGNVLEAGNHHMAHRSVPVVGCDEEGERSMPMTQARPDAQELAHSSGDLRVAVVTGSGDAWIPVVGREGRCPWVRIAACPLRVARPC